MAVAWGMHLQACVQKGVFREFHTVVAHGCHLWHQAQLQGSWQLLPDIDHGLTKSGSSKLIQQGSETFKAAPRLCGVACLRLLGLFCCEGLPACQAAAGCCRGSCRPIVQALAAVFARYLGITSAQRATGTVGTVMHEDGLASKPGFATVPKCLATCLLTWSGRALTGAAGMAGLKWAAEQVTPGAGLTGVQASCRLPYTGATTDHQRLVYRAGHGHEELCHQNAHCW